jgi:C4-type Zn-finger protein
MKSSYERVDCPRCGADAEIEAWEEYQGVRPHGGYVSRIQVTEKNCDCEWSDDEFEDMQSAAARQSSQRARNFSPEEIHRTRL